MTRPVQNVQRTSMNATIKQSCQRILPPSLIKTAQNCSKLLKSANPSQPRSQPPREHPVHQAQLVLPVPGTHGVPRVRNAVRKEKQQKKSQVSKKLQKEMPLDYHSSAPHGILLLRRTPRIPRRGCVAYRTTKKNILRKLTWQGDVSDHSRHHTCPSSPCPFCPSLRLRAARVVRCPLSFHGPCESTNSLEKCGQHDDPQWNALLRNPLLAQVTP